MKKNFENILGGAIANSIAGEKAIKDSIIIREEFKKLIPPLSPEEFEQLESNILKEGVRDPIVLWENGSDYILVDGHNRFSICSKHNLSFPFKIVQFKDEEEVNDWMIKNQLGRRNLTPEQQSYLRGLRYNREKAQGKRTDLTLDQNDLKSESTAVALANEYNVSEATIKRDGEFASGVELLSSQTPGIKDEILQGKSKLSKQEIRNASKSKKRIGAKGTKKVSKKSPSANEVAEIALNYLQSEQRPFAEVCTSIGFESDNSQAIDFFSMWNNKVKIMKTTILIILFGIIFIPALAQIDPVYKQVVEYSTITVRLNGDHIVYQNKTPDISPKVTMPDGTTWCLYEDRKEGSQLKDLATLINHMASFGWRLKDICNLNSETLMLLIFEREPIKIDLINDGKPEN